MIVVDRLRSRRPVVPDSMPVARPPVILRGPLLQAVRVCWMVMAAAGLTIWMIEIPLVYHAALQLQNTTGMFTLSPGGWRTGLHRLGISPSVYAAQSVAGLSLMTASMYLIGLLIFVRRSREWIALLTSYMFVTVGVGIINFYSGGPALMKAHPDLSSPLHLYSGLADLGWGVLFLVPLTFPDGRFVPHWTGWVAAIFFLRAVMPSDLVPLPVWIADPLTILFFATILLSPIYRYRRVSDATQRQQTKWVMFGFIVALGVFAGLSLVQALVPGMQERPERTVLLELIGGSLFYLGFAFLPVCFALGILRYRLWDIDLVLNRALVYSVLTASVVGLYVLIVAGLGALFQAEGNLALSLLATALVAILFHPLHQRLQRGVNRLLYGRRDEPYAVLSRLGQQLEGTLAPDAVLPAIVQTVAEALKLPSAAIALQREGQETVVAAVGSIGHEPLRLPLVYQGEPVGALLLGLRPGESAFAPADRRLLDDLARQAGVAAYAVRLTTDLQRSRERLVTTREEERRRLRRDLHDGLGPALASMMLQAETAHDLVQSDPAESEALLSGLIDQLSAATSDIRRLVYNLRPPALDDLGLCGAIRAQVRQYDHSPLRVQLDLPDVTPPLPAAVEVAAYRIVLEALTNVVRHADARRCTVRLAVSDLLTLTISDDGKGLPAQVRAGIGLASVRERAAELGGSCLVDRGPAGGVQICARLPLAMTGDLRARREVPNGADSRPHS